MTPVRRPTLAYQTVPQAADTPWYVCARRAPAPRDSGTLLR